MATLPIALPLPAPPPLARPIPALYTTYLLRSCERPASLYVGSTPHLRRRLAQHNGQVVGGARRTARQALRPWAVACAVLGFPSSVAALQFEWAWQNPHLTRHIAPSARLAPRTTALRTSRKSGRPRHAVVRPPSSLIDRLANLHLLLRAPRFARWPLELRFFAHDVHRAWCEWEMRTEVKIPPWTRVVLEDEAQEEIREIHPPKSRPVEEKAVKARRKASKKSVQSEEVEKQRGIDNTQVPEESTDVQQEREIEKKSGVDALDVTYAPLREHVQKSLSLLAEGTFANCAVCKASLKTPGGMTLVCPTQSCRATSHLNCLSRTFLATDDGSNVLPVQGRCPKCKEELRWVDLVKELSLRMRGPTEVERLLKKPRRQKARSPGKPTAQAMIRESSDDGMASELEDELQYGYLVDEADQHEAHLPSDDITLPSTSSIASRLSELSHHIQPLRSSRMVIPDSEWDDAEVLD